MKKILFFLAAALLSVACVPENITSEFTVSGPDGTFYNGGFMLEGTRQLIPVTVTPANAKAHYTVAAPADQQWCTCFQDETDGIWKLSVSQNNTGSPRSSYIFIRCGEETQNVTVWQDYMKTLSFVNTNNTIDAAAGDYSIPLKTNLPDDEITVEIDAECTWITAGTVKKGILVLTAQKNESTTDSRRTQVTVVSGARRATANIEQIPLSGNPYIIPISTLNLSTYPVYEIFDNVNNVKIGEICKEYLYKYDAIENQLIVEGSFTVAYPMKEEFVDYTKGLVVNNGGMVVWDEETKMISNYFAGTGTSDGNLYLPAGATQMRLAPLDASEAATAITAVCNPVTVTVTRTGAADNHGNTSETYKYTVLKLGLQYWMKENFKSTRLADGTPIMTNVSVEDWVKNTTPILKPMCLTAGDGGTFIDANDPAAASVRNDAGCLYTYAALVGQNIDVSAAKAATFVKEDRISPNGWAVPSLNDMQQLYSYVKQKEYATTKEETNDLLPKLLRSGNNITGFSAAGTRQRGYTGKYNNVLYYMTLDYSYEGGHMVYQLRLNASNTLICTLTSAGGTYLRLIRKSQ